ncbi:hypothetical protein EON63_22285 [archaeon]|nr:MAG: hypothetical protein EON63_22285 [archaeon]
MRNKPLKQSNNLLLLQHGNSTQLRTNTKQYYDAMLTTAAAYEKAWPRELLSMYICMYVCMYVCICT